MFFPASKILGFFALPSNLLLVFALAGIILLPSRFSRCGRRLMVGSILAALFVGYSPVGNLLLVILEQRFPPPADISPPHGIVVLGGAVGPEVSAARGEAALNEAAERITAAAVLARRYPEARLLYSGGSGRLGGGLDEAQFALQALVALGVERSRILLEDRSRNTIENAIFAKQIAAPKPGERWWLVTSAYHMPRSIGAFRAAGFEVEAYPVDFRTRGWSDVWVPFSVLSEGLARTDTAVREWVGLVAYWLSGRSSALFPSPTR